jgi:hypothetical protein
MPSLSLHLLAYRTTATHEKKESEDGSQKMPLLGTASADDFPRRIPDDKGQGQ